MTDDSPAGPPRVVGWRGTGNGHRTWSSPEWATLTGQDERGSHGLGWLEAVHPEDRQQVLGEWEAAAVSGSLLTDQRIRTAGGAYVRYRSGALPGGLPGDPATAWAGSSVQTEDLAAALEGQGVLLDALRHRVRNTLGSVRSMARLSLHGGEAAEEYAAALDGRIASMARVQAELIRNPLARTDLAQLVAGELSALALREGERVRIDGPVVHLRPRAAENMGLALHELAVNALRHGAISVQDGTIDVSWRLEGEGAAAQLHFDWREAGAGCVADAAGFRGFGMQVLESYLPYQLGAETRLHFAPAGLHVSIELPAATCILPQD